MRNAAEIRHAACSYQNSITNQTPLKYAPWVLNLLLIVMVRDQLKGYSPREWIGLGLALVALPFAASFARDTSTEAISRPSPEAVEL